MRELRDLYGISAGVGDLVARKNELYLKLARKNTPVFPEMRRLLDVLVQRKIPRAVATGSSRDVVREVLDFTGLAAYFDVVLSSDDVGRSKPAPDVFLAAAGVVTPAMAWVLPLVRAGPPGRTSTRASP